VFAVCVAISTAIWAGAWLVIGRYFGHSVELWIRSHTRLSIAIPAVWLTFVVGFVVYRCACTSGQRRRIRSNRSATRDGRPVRPSNASASRRARTPA